MYIKTAIWTWNWMLLTASVQNSAAISMKVLIPYCASDSLVFSGTQPVWFVLLSSVHSSLIVTLAVARSKWSMPTLAETCHMLVVNSEIASNTAVNVCWVFWWPCYSCQGTNSLWRCNNKLAVSKDRTFSSLDTSLPAPPLSQYEFGTLRCLVMCLIIKPVALTLLVTLTAP